MVCLRAVTGRGLCVHRFQIFVVMRQNRGDYTPWQLHPSDIPQAPKSLPHLCVIVAKSKIHYQWEWKQEVRMWQIDYLHGQRQRQRATSLLLWFWLFPHLCLPQQEARCMAVSSEVQRKAGRRWGRRASSQHKETSLECVWHPQRRSHRTWEIFSHCFSRVERRRQGSSGYSFNSVCTLTTLNTVVTR